MTRYIRHSTPYIANSDTPLLTLGGQPWTARHTFEATMVCGGYGVCNGAQRRRLCATSGPDVQSARARHGKPA